MNIEKKCKHEWLRWNCIHCHSHIQDVNKKLVEEHMQLTKRSPKDIIKVEEFLPEKLGDFIVHTDIKCPLQINGTATFESDSPIQYGMQYKVGNKTKFVVVNKETYEFVRQLFDLLKCMEEPTLIQVANSSTYEEEV